MNHYDRIMKNIAARTVNGKYVVAPNGMNLNEALTNPKSNASRILSYIQENGPQTRRSLIENVLGKTVAPIGVIHVWNTPYVSRSQCAWTFLLLVNLGHLTKVRKGNTVTYHLTNS